VRLAHNTLLVHPADLREGHQQPHPQAPTTNGHVPFLPPLPKVDPIPAQHPSNDNARFLFVFFST